MLSAYLDYAATLIDPASSEKQYSGTAAAQAFEALYGPVIDSRVGVSTNETLSFRYPDGSYVQEDEFQDVVQSLNPVNISATHGDVPRLMNGEGACR
jgi:hypothetical protein